MVLWCLLQRGGPGATAILGSGVLASLSSFVPESAWPLPSPATPPPS